MTNFSQIVRQARARLLQMHYESGVGHIGGNLSCLDMLLMLFHQVLRPDDAFVLSKGHAAGALYTTLWSLGRLTDEDLKQFPQGRHPTERPSRAQSSCPRSSSPPAAWATGFPWRRAWRWGGRCRSEPGRVFCLLSDGEWQEGSNWEALIFAAHRRLPLTLIVDTNGLQGFGSTARDRRPGDAGREVPGIRRADGGDDGHDLDALHDGTGAAHGGDPRRRSPTPARAAASPSWRTRWSGTTCP